MLTRCSETKGVYDVVMDDAANATKDWRLATRVVLDLIRIELGSILVFFLFAVLTQILVHRGFMREAILGSAIMRWNSKRAAFFLVVCASPIMRSRRGWYRAVEQLPVRQSAMGTILWIVGVVMIPALLFAFAMLSKVGLSGSAGTGESTAELALLLANSFATLGTMCLLLVLCSRQVSAEMMRLAVIGGAYVFLPHTCEQAGAVSLVLLGIGLSFAGLSLFFVGRLTGACMGVHRMIHRQRNQSGTRDRGAPRRGFVRSCLGWFVVGLFVPVVPMLGVFLAKGITIAAADSADPVRFTAFAVSAAAFLVAIVLCGAFSIARLRCYRSLPISGLRLTGVMASTHVALHLGCFVGTAMFVLGSRVSTLWHLLAALCLSCALALGAQTMYLLVSPDRKVCRTLVLAGMAIVLPFSVWLPTWILFAFGAFLMMLDLMITIRSAVWSRDAYMRSQWLETLARERGLRT